MFLCFIQNKLTIEFQYPHLSKTNSLTLEITYFIHTEETDTGSKTSSKNTINRKNFIYRVQCSVYVCLHVCKVREIILY